MKLLIKKTVILSSLLISVSCSTKIKNFDTYHRALMEESPFISAENIKNNDVKVIILDIDNNEITEAKNAKIGNTSSAKIESILAESKLVKIAERDNIENLQKEIALSELNSDQIYSGPEIADYVVTGKIISAGLEHKFQSSYSYYNAASGTYVRVPAKNKYEAKVSGNFKILELPSLKVLDIIEFNGEEYRFEDAIENRSFLSSKIDPSNIKSEDNELLRKAAIDAIEDNSHEIKNIFANFKRGYIFEKRNNGKKDIFLINLGKNDNLKTGMKLDLYTLEEYSEPFSDSVTIEEIKIGDVTVTDKILDDKAWIIINDKKIVNKIKLGDFVKLKFKKSFAKTFDSISDKTKSLVY